MKETKPLKNGEPMTVNFPDHKTVCWNVTCCDCHLSHLFVFHREGGNVVVRAYKDDFETQKNRARVKK